MICPGVNPVHVVMVVASGLFDKDWYVSRYPDVLSSDMSPLEHFMLQGWMEGRDPSDYFDTGWYLSRYLSGDGSASNPLIHYLTVGWRRGDWPTPWLNPDDVARSHPAVTQCDVPSAVFVASRAFAQSNAPRAEEEALYTFIGDDSGSGHE